jgi:hypothetical protein
MAGGGAPAVWGWRLGVASRRWKDGRRPIRLQARLGLKPGLPRRLAGGQARRARVPKRAACAGRRRRHPAVAKSKPFATRGYTGRARAGRAGRARRAGPRRRSGRRTCALEAPQSEAHLWRGEPRRRFLVRMQPPGQRRRSGTEWPSVAYQAAMCSKPTTPSPAATMQKFN